MASLDEVLSGEPTNESTELRNQPVETQHTAETPEAPEPEVEVGAEGDGAPAAPGHDKTVPLKALEAERTQRQDWKEKAVRFEEQLKAVQMQMEQMQRNQSQPQNQERQQMEMTPELMMLNERMNFSEMIARKEYPDLDAKFEVFQKAAAENPALGAELLKQSHPYDWMYKQAAKLQALADIGDDPTAYEQRMREKIMAELTAQQPAPVETQQPAQQNAALGLPKSLATARSAGPRNGPTFTGPTPLGDVLKR